MSRKKKNNKVRDGVLYILDNSQTIRAKRIHDRSSIHAVVLPQTVRTIGAGAFKGCTRLKKFEAPQSLHVIGPEAFAGCEALAVVDFGPELVRLGADAFAGCASLRNVTLAPNVQIVGNGAFAGCKSLASADLGSGVNVVGAHAFTGCTSLASVTLGSSVTAIGEHAFDGCTSLQRFTCAAPSPELGPFVFGRVPASAVFEIPGGWDRSMFGNVGADGWIICGDVCAGYVGDAPDIRIPDGITALASHAIWNRNVLENVCFPEGLVSIGVQAFADCRKLQEADLPSSVAVMESGAFRNCASLNRFAFAGKDMQAAPDVLRGCPRTLQLNIPKTFGDERFGAPDETGWIISQGALKGYCGVEDTRLIIPETVREIGPSTLDRCVRGMDGSREIELPESLRRLGFQEMFSDCRYTFIVPDSFWQHAHPQNSVLALMDRLPDLGASVLADIFLRQGAAASAKALERLTRMMGDTGTADLLVKGLDHSRSQTARLRLVDLFRRKPEMFEGPLRGRLMDALSRARTRKEWSGNADQKLPEPVLDEILLSEKIDPDAPVWHRIRMAHSNETVPPDQPKRAVVRYLLFGRTLSPWGGSISRDQAADTAARCLNAKDMAVAVEQLVEPSAPARLAAFLRFARGPAVAAVIGSTDGKRAKDWAKCDFLCLSHTPEALLLCAHTPKPPPRLHRKHPLERYLELLDTSALPKDVFPSDANGIILDHTLRAHLEPGLEITVTDGHKTWKRFPAAGSEKARRVHEALTLWTKNCKEKAGSALFRAYAFGHAMKKWKNPTFALAAAGTVFRQEDQCFALVDGTPLNVQGHPAEVDRAAPVHVPHATQLTADEKDSWKAFFAARNIAPWLFQLTEPVYEASQIAPDRYEYCTIRASSVRFPGGPEFVCSMLEESRHKHPISLRWWQDEHEKSAFRLGRVRVSEIVPCVNTLLFLLDQLTAADQAEKGNLSALPAIALASTQRLNRCLETAIDQPEMMAHLLQIKHERGHRSADSTFHL